MYNTTDSHIIVLFAQIDVTFALYAPLLKYLLCSIHRQNNFSTLIILMLAISFSMFCAEVNKLAKDMFTNPPAITSTFMLKCHY